MATRALDKKYLKTIPTRQSNALRSEADCRSRSHESDFVEIDHEIILLLPLIQEGLMSVTSESARSTALSQACPGKNMWLGELTVRT